MGRFVRFRGLAYVGLLVVFALSSCSEQGTPTGEEAEPPPREVTKEVTRTVTVAETPKAPEAKRDARAALVPAESPPPAKESGPDYVAVADGALSVEVPSSWGEIITGEDSEEGSGWSGFSGESVDYSITAAPSLDSWGSAPGAPGVYAVASAGLAQRYANEDLVATGPNDLSGACEAGVRRAFEREPYSGLVQEWDNCGEDGGAYLTLAATPRDGGCVVLLTVGTADPGGDAAGQHALDTFGADCGATASYPLASADEQYATEDVPLTDQDTSDEYNLEEQCAALGKVRAGRGCAPPPSVRYRSPAEHHPRLGSAGDLSRCSDQPRLRPRSRLLDSGGHKREPVRVLHP